MTGGSESKKASSGGGIPLSGRALLFMGWAFFCMVWWGSGMLLDGLKHAKRLKSHSQRIVKPAPVRREIYTTIRVR